MSVELNTNLSAIGNNKTSPLLNNTSFTSAQIPNSVFSATSNTNNPLAQPVSGNYEEDILMPDFLKTENTLKQTQNTQTPNQLQAQTDNTAQQNNTAETQQAQPQIDESKLTNSLLARDKSLAFTDKGNIYRKTSTAKTGLAILGFLAPAAGKIIDLFKGGKISELFKFKQLAIACPAVALAGYGVGSLIDGYINSNRAKIADTEPMLKVQQDVSTQQPTKDAA
jgi:hypothetical protein